MTKDKVAGLLGIARRAGKLSLGHDAVLIAVKNGDAALVLLAADASERLCSEFARASETYHTVSLQTTYEMNEIGQSLGCKKTAVLSVNDHGFAEKIKELLGRE